MLLLTTPFTASAAQKSPGEKTQGAAHTQWITPDNDIDLSGMNLYCQSDYIQFIADSDAKISLYVNAEKDDDGLFSFDTGHDWLLIMETSIGNYPLFPRRRIQHGMVSYDVFNSDSGSAYDIFHVLVTVRESAGHEIYECIFDNAKNAFRVAPVYNATNINPTGRSR